MATTKLSTRETIVRVAVDNTWSIDRHAMSTRTLQTDVISHTYRRGNVSVYVEYAANSSVRYASRTIAGRVEDVLTTRAASKLQTIMGWLETPDMHAGWVVTATETGTVTDHRTDAQRTEDTVDAAAALLTDTVTTLAAETVCSTDVYPLYTADAPNTWEALQAAAEKWRPLGYLPVWNGASGRTIYGTESANHAFRYWHDMGHLEHGLGFTPADETALQLEHHMPLVWERLGINGLPSAAAQLAARLYYADTIGQIEYSVRHRAFPTDQRAFVLAYVTDPAAAVESEF